MVKHCQSEVNAELLIAIRNPVPFRRLLLGDCWHVLCFNRGTTAPVAARHQRVNSGGSGE